MLSEILLTATVATAAWLVIRQRRNPRPPLYTPRPNPPPPPPMAPLRGGKGILIRGLAATLLAVGVLGIGWLLYDHWFDARRIVEVQVINSNTGQITRYDARKGDVDSKSGTFTTLSGREVVVAGVERIEIQ